MQWDWQLEEEGEEEEEVGQRCTVCVIMILAGVRGVVGSRRMECVSSREHLRRQRHDDGDVFGRQRRPAFVASHITRSIRRAHNLMQSRSRAKVALSAGVAETPPYRGGKRHRVSAEDEASERSGKRPRCTTVSVNVCALCDVNRGFVELLKCRFGVCLALASLAK